MPQFWTGPVLTPKCRSQSRSGEFGLRLVLGGVVSLNIIVGDARASQQTGDQLAGGVLIRHYVIRVETVC